MTDTITLTGLIATPPRHVVTSEGLAITNFRLVSNQRRYDRAQERWVDADTNWYTITSFRHLAINASTSLQKGERVVVTGRLRLREWDNGEKQGLNVDVEAEAIGHDLAWGTTTFSRSISASAAQQVESPAESATGAEEPVAPSDAESTDAPALAETEPAAALPF